MAKVALYVWIITVCSTVVLSLFLVGNSYYLRYRWLTCSTVLAVMVDFGLWWMHTNHHVLYEPLRLFIFYALFYMLNGLIIWEAYRLRDRRVQIPVEFYLGMQLVALIAHRTEFVWFTYYFECFTRIINLLMVFYFIHLFSKENSDAPQP